MLKPIADVIVYNEFGTGTNRRFLKTIIRNVIFDDDQVGRIVNLGLQNNSRVAVYSLRGRTDLSDYVTPKIWATLTREEANEKWTLQTNDRIIKLTPEWENAPMEFTSNIQVDNYFNTPNNKASFTIIGVSMPDMDFDKISHMEVLGN